jgi:hypothetical protein
MDEITGRLAAAALAALAAASAVPIPLAQLDFAGVANLLDIDSGDTPPAVLLVAGLGGVLTIAVLGLAIAGAALAPSRPAAASRLLVAAALAGLLSAGPLWFPAGLVLGAAAWLLRRPAPGCAS